MKIMTCKQLGGACNLEFRASTFDDIVKLSKQHGLEMFQNQDDHHLKAMNEMQELMKNPSGLMDWFNKKKNEFEALPEDL